MADVFLSYAREDRAKAEQIATALSAGGYNVFWDVEIPPGTSWADFLAEKLASSRAAIVLWSKTSTASQWVREEARLARDKGKLIPVMIDESAPPFGFGEIQAANLAAWNGEADNPQWKLLLAGLARATGAEATGKAQAPPIHAAAGGWSSSGGNPRESAATAPARKGASPIVMIGGGLAALVAVFAIVGAMNGGRGAPQSGPLPTQVDGPMNTGGPAPPQTALSPEIQQILAQAQEASNQGAAAMKTAADYAAKGQAAAAQAPTGANGYGVSQGPMGMIAGDLVGLKGGSEAAVGIAMAQGTQFYGAMQALNAQGTSYTMNGNALVTGGGAASGKWTYSGGQFDFVGGGSVPNKYALLTHESGPADGSATRGLGRISYPNGEIYFGEYRAVGEGVQAQVFRNGLGVHYDAKGAVKNAGRFTNDAFDGPS